MCLLLCFFWEQFIHLWDRCREDCHTFWLGVGVFWSDRCAQRGVSQPAQRDRCLQVMSATPCDDWQVFTGGGCHTLWWLTGLCWCNRCREENVVTSSYWYNYLCRWRVSYPVTTCMCLQVKSVILCDYWHVFTGEACHTPWLLMCFYKTSVNCYTHDYDCWQAFTSEKCYTL